MRTLTLAVCTLVLSACTAPTAPILPAAAPTRPPAAGIGVCHWIPAQGLPDEVDFGTETTTVVHWNQLEPLPDIHNWGPIDQYIHERRNSDLAAWLNIRTYGADLAGNPIAPQWLIDEGAAWHAPCGNHKAIFAPWDPVYLRRLDILLTAINDHISRQPQAYQDTIAGIVMMSGGVYGETHLYQWDEECNLQTALIDYYGLHHLTPYQFDEAYAESVLRILDRYMTAFPDWPIMVQLGRPPADEWLLRYGSAAYPGRLYAKWQGWAPTNVGDGKDHIRKKANEYYSALFRAYHGQVHSGFEPGHPTEEWLGPDQYINAINTALNAKLSFVCFPAGETLWKAYALPQWAALDAQLEANAAIPITPTPAPTCTREPWPTHTPSPIPTVTLAPTPPPVQVIWQCECRPVTTTPPAP